MHSADKPVASVCHAPAVLRHCKAPDGSPLVKGKAVTDGKLITGQNPASSEPVAKALVAMIQL